MFWGIKTARAISKCGKFSLCLSIVILVLILSRNFIVSGDSSSR